MKNYSLAVIFWLGLTVFVFAQDENEVVISRQDLERTPAMRQLKKETIKQQVRSIWNGDKSNVTVISWLMEDQLHEEIGISGQTVKEAFTFTDMNNDPELKPFRDELNELLNTPVIGLEGWQEREKRIYELDTEINAVMDKRIINRLDENLTSDQKKKIKEFQISTMSEYPFVSPSMFEALDLSDDQKEQLAGIKKEMEPEFEKIVDRMAGLHLAFEEKFQDENAGKLDGVENGSEELKRILENARKKVRESNPELQREMDETTESGKALAQNLKFRMFDVLTDEQMERMADLIDNPPDYAKKVLARMRKQFGNDDLQTSSEWKPGPNSWKPGDPIPEEYLQQRQERRFPSRQ